MRQLLSAPPVPTEANLIPLVPCASDEPGVVATAKARHAQMPWREMAAAGNFYRHNYEDVSPRRAWKTLHEDLPRLRLVIERELGSQP